MTAAKTTLNRWRDRFAELDDCPWPGPRPLRGGDQADGAHLLIGRVRDRARFRAEVDRYRLVYLTGPSGVGKTSLIEAGLIPELEVAGDYVVSLCRDWSGGADAEDALAFLAAKVTRGLIDGGYNGWLDPNPEEFFWALERDLPGRLVLVFDQFEELLRDATQLAEELFPILIAINHETKIRVVLSFRSEYLNELKAVENQATPFSFSHIDLNQVDPSFAEDIVLAGNHDQSEAIEDGAAKAVAKAWAEACGRQTGGTTVDRFGKIGLLHLQALLYSLHGEAGGATIGQSVADRVSTTDPIELFSEGMRSAIDIKLARCRQASEDLGLDRYLVEGTAGFVARSVGHLSSVGYKLVRGAADLWASTLGDQLDRLPEDHENLLMAVTSTILLDNRDESLDLLDASREDLAERADVDGHWAVAIIPAPDLDDDPTGSDPLELACGPMTGLPPAAVLVEELRRFAFALEWLQTSSLARISTPGRQGAMVSLIHDGFGAALERWSQRSKNLPAIALSALMAPSGASFMWQFDGNPTPAHDVLDGTLGTGLVPNLRWKGAWVQASFRNIQFVNCDFRGAGFSRCVFTGVSFVNCLLDGAMFTECTVIGSPSHAPGGYDIAAPEYRIEAPSDLLDAIARYRGTPSADYLLSPLPGLPAIPAADSARGEAWSPELSGLAFYGGRVSSLVLRTTRFADGGQVSFRQVAGAGLDIVEQRVGDFEIVGSSIRHLTVSAPVMGSSVDADLAGAGAQTRGQATRMALRVAGSALAQAWFSTDLDGDLVIHDCTLVQIWNGSESLRAKATSCRHFDLVNVEIDDDSSLVDALGAPAALEAADPGGLVIRQRAKGMDYLRNPAAVAAAISRSERA